MSDSDIGNASWLTPPSEYARLRAPDCACPDPRSVYVPMRDGCRLAVDYYLPQSHDAIPDPNFPTIVIFTPYYRRFALADPSLATEPTPNICKYRDYFVPRGYALVAVDVRGTGASFGTRDSFRSPREREDYGEIASWIAGQPWCNGSIGATGISYLGAASDFLASTGHPAVKAIAPISAVWDTWADNYYPGGVLLNRLSQTYDRLMTALDHDRRELLKEFGYFKDPNFAGPQPVDEDADGELRRAAVQEHLGNFRMPDFITEFPCRDDSLPYDRSFTSANFSPYHYREGIRDTVAVLSISGWTDGAGYANGAISRFLTLNRNPRHLLLGPWDHGARVNTSPWRTRPAPEFDILDPILRFFDHYLRGMDTGLQDEQPVHYFSVHEEAWHGANDWPPHDAQSAFHLAPGGRLTTEAQADGMDDMQADFAFGTGNQTRYERIAGHDTQNYYTDWQAREGQLLSYTSEPLPADAELTGHAVADFWLTSSEPDAAIHAFISEVTPNGKVHYVTEGLLRALHRHESIAPDACRTSWPFRAYARRDIRPMPAGVPQNLRFALLPVSWTFSRGSRIRLSIAGHDADHSIQIPHGRPPRLALLRQAKQRSLLILPLHFKP